MNEQWHEQIQRHVSGQSSPTEAAALRAALNEDAALRALYLDYVNLDTALSAMADTADAALPVETSPGEAAIETRTPPRWAVRPWRWAGAAAACAVAVAVVMISQRRDSPRAQPDLAAVTAATQVAISRLPLEVPPALPAWMSPTASLLDQPVFPK